MYMQSLVDRGAVKQVKSKGNKEHEERWLLFEESLLKPNILLYLFLWKTKYSIIFISMAYQLTLSVALLTVFDLLPLEYYVLKARIIVLLQTVKAEKDNKTQ